MFSIASFTDDDDAKSNAKHESRTKESNAINEPIIQSEQSNDARVTAPVYDK